MDIVILLSVFKEKSWSVRLVDGYVQNNQVKSERCKGCESSAKLVVGNNGQPNFQLYGCSKHKCRHILLKLKFSDQDSIEYANTSIDAVPLIVPTEDRIALEMPGVDAVQPPPFDPMVVGAIVQSQNFKGTQIQV